LELAAEHAVPGRRAISVDKASVFATSRLWRSLATVVAAERGVKFDNVNVDRAAYELVRFDDLPAVIATEGIFGDILSDVVCARAGSPALCGSATINPSRGPGVTALFEPAHGSSPHRTGSRRSNPTGAWLALAALLDWCDDLRPYGMSARIRAALADVHARGVRTYDLAGAVGMDDVNAHVLEVLS
jgi:3-isopropylmalate dehydrogenase